MRKFLGLSYFALGVILHLSALSLADEHGGGPETKLTHPKPEVAVTKPGKPSNDKTITKSTKTGHVFTRDFSNPKLGEAWRDPSELVWGDVVKDDLGYLQGNWKNVEKAARYCRSIGARLPSPEEFIRLREYMGAKHGRPVNLKGYVPQILPNLTFPGDFADEPRRFLTSLVDPDDDSPGYIRVFTFYGRNGYITKHDTENFFFSDNFVVRCVMGPNTATP